MPQAQSLSQDPARTILEGLSGVPDNVKALAHDTYWQTGDRQTFETRIGALPIPDKAKADLWDAKYHIARPPIPGTKPPLPKWKQWADVALDQLPMVGGAVGGIGGGIAGTATAGPVGGFFGGVGGAMGGGAAGEAVREYGKARLGTMEPPKTRQEALTNIGTEGLIQGGLEVGGLGLMAGTARLGRAMVGAGVRPSQTLLEGFHDILDTIIAERVPVGQSGKMAALRKESAGVLKSILNRAEQAGTTFQATAVGKELVPLIKSLKNQAVSARDQSQLYKLITEFLDKHKNPITPTALKALKQTAQQKSGPVLKAMEKGLAAPTAKQTLEARFQYAIARGARQELETITGKAPLKVGGKTVRVGVKQAEKVTQSRIGAARALREAEHRPPGAWAQSVPLVSGIVTGLVSGQRGSSLSEEFRNGVVAWLIAEGLTSPKGLSRGGLMLTSATARRLFRQFPRLHMSVIETLTRPELGLAGTTAPAQEAAAPASAPAPAPIPRQAGGPVQPGRPYLVGEQGPEVIVPFESGTVVPNQATPSRAGANEKKETAVPDPMTALQKAQTIGPPMRRTIYGTRPEPSYEEWFPTWLRSLLAPNPGAEIANFGMPLAMMASPAEQLAEAARRNPGLDMSDAARMMRAFRQGKTLRTYRGTLSPNDYRELRPAVNPEHEFGIHAGSTRETAENFTSHGNPRSRILDLLANPGRSLETPDIGSFKSPASWIWKLQQQLDPSANRARYPEPTDPDTLQAIIDLAHQFRPQTNPWGYYTPDAHANFVDFQTALRNLLLGRDYQSLTYPNFVEGGGTPSYLFLDPRQLRSIYAAFNPTKLGSAHLLDSILAALALGGAGAASTGASGGGSPSPPGRTATTPTTRSQ